MTDPQISRADPRAEQRIDLDVGNMIYSTTRSTLARAKSPFFHRILKSEQRGAHFIDRDGAIFSYILSYMRNGVLHIDRADKMLIQMLITEATFYHLVDLEKTLLQWLSQSS